MKPSSLGIRLQPFHILPSGQRTSYIVHLQDDTNGPLVDRRTSNATMSPFMDPTLFSGVQWSAVLAAKHRETLRFEAVVRTS
jgi:hypothetical protein